MLRVRARLFAHAFSSWSFLATTELQREMTLLIPKHVSSPRQFSLPELFVFRRGRLSRLRGLASPLAQVVLDEPTKNNEPNPSHLLCIVEPRPVQPPSSMLP